MLGDYFLNKAVHIMPIKYFIWYVIVAGWQETSPILFIANYTGPKF